MKAAVIAVIAVFALCASAHHMFSFDRFSMGAKGHIGKVVFTPHKLPCSFGINAHTDCYESGRVGWSYNNSIYRNGKNTLEATYFAILCDVFTTRFDQSYEEQGKTMVPVYHGWKRPSASCETTAYETSDIESSIEYHLRMFLESSSFDSVTPSSFKGKKCNMYTREEDAFELYADENNFIIGYADKSKPATILISDVSYDFNFTMNVFAQSRISFPDCDDKAYTTPKDQC